MKNIILQAALLFVCAGATYAQENPGWIRKSSISPDGKVIAFAWNGNIYTVSSEGGEARQITSNPAYETDPLWAADGRSIIFSSFRENSKDIWIVPAEGGTPARITTAPGAETPLTVAPDGSVWFSANIQPDASYKEFPGQPQIWSSPLSGGKPVMVSSIPMASVSVNAEGTILYEDIKGVEDNLRKHSTSAVTRDVWCSSNGKFTKLSTYIGENRNPVFAADGDTFFFLRENVTDNPNAPEACFNVWKSSVSNPSRQTQITFFRTHPVRYLSIARDGTLLFSWNGDLYTAREGSEPRKIGISLRSDFNERKQVFTSVSVNKGIAVSPEGKEVAVISRGEVYVTAVDAKSTRRITNTPAQERSLAFSKDGRTLYYSSERDGEWGIWSSSLVNKEDKLFSMAWTFKEERVTSPGQTCFQPSVSPDGKWLAFLRDRTEIVIKNLKSGAEKSLYKGVNYSYRDGDQEFCWSPDSRYIITSSHEKAGWQSSDGVLIDIYDGSTTNLTRSGYSDYDFRWALGGKAMTWESDRHGFASNLSSGSREDVYIMFFDGKAYHDFFQSKEEDDLDKLLKEGDKKSEAKKDTTKKEKKVEPLKLDLASIEDRTRKLTPISGPMGDHILSENGTKLFFAMRSDKGTALYCLNIKNGSLSQVQKSFSGRFVTSANGKHVFVQSPLGISKFYTASGTTKSISFSGEYEYRPAEERAYMFEHCWKQVAEKFYDPSIHGVDWQAMHDNYVRFLPFIDNNYDFRELLSELLGELNGSHTGARYNRLLTGSPWSAHFGVLFDNTFAGPGLKIAELLPGSILAAEDPDIKAGDLILAVDGKEIPEGQTWYDALAVHSRQRMQLRIKKAKGGIAVINLKPASSDSDELYIRWIRQREAIVERLSGGRVGYVHVKGMDAGSFNEVYSRALGKYRGCEALIVDTRHNHGGWLHDDLLNFLGGKTYLDYNPRGQHIGSEPFNKWTKPSCVLMGEDNYSDACGFPYIYKAFGLGKLIGAPVPGTMTAVWWENLLDPTMVFGIPQVTVVGKHVDSVLENYQIEPDILVYNDPESLLRGEDKQLEAAVAEMMKVIGK